MKIFYRPNGLAPPPIDAMGKIKFSLKNIDNQYVIIANNPTPYFVSFGQIQLQSQQKKLPDRTVDGYDDRPILHTTLLF